MNPLRDGIVDSIELAKLTYAVPSIDIRVEPLLEGAAEPWRWLDARTVLVAPSVFEELKRTIPVVSR